MRGRGPGKLAVLLAAGALVAALAAGCSSKANTGGGSSGSPSPEGSPNPASPAQITIVQPLSGSTVTGTTVHVVLTLVGATLVPPGTVSGVDPTHGHIHLSLDGEIVSMTSGLTYDMQVTHTGHHLLTAEFVANNHQSFSPRDLKTVDFTDQ
ncbi:MAG TPA: hypothetical protein VFW71_08465 [Actinomycetota bacterium]|nr:hypothetical protein [Actinomycetota bacterium]